MLARIEAELPGKPFVIAHAFERDGRALHLGVTDRLRRVAKRGRVWKSNAFLTALKNAEYGFDESRARSVGGADGIFLLDRHYEPKNEMMRKIFDRFIDKETERVDAIARELNARPDQLRAARLVSHHLRLLGLLHSNEEGDWLILVDYDDTK